MFYTSTFQYQVSPTVTDADLRSYCDQVHSFQITVLRSKVKRDFLFQKEYGSGVRVAPQGYYSFSVYPRLGVVPEAVATIRGADDACSSLEVVIQFSDLWKFGFVIGHLIAVVGGIGIGFEEGLFSGIWTGFALLASLHLYIYTAHIIQKKRYNELFEQLVEQLKASSQRAE